CTTEAFFHGLYILLKGTECGQKANFALARLSGFQFKRGMNGRLFPIVFSPSIAPQRPLGSDNPFRTPEKEFRPADAVRVRIGVNACQATALNADRYHLRPITNDRPSA